VTGVEDNENFAAVGIPYPPLPMAQCVTGNANSVALGVIINFHRYE
jgi:hypothetical protein